MAGGSEHHAKGSKKGRKRGRNFRWDGIMHSVTKYRARHHIGSDEVRFPNSQRRKVNTVDNGKQGK